MVRKEKKFSELDIDKVYFDNGSWSFGRGGLPLNDLEWFISETDEDGSTIRYKLPEVLNQIINTSRNWQEIATQKNIQRALGL